MRVQDYTKAVISLVREGKDTPELLTHLKKVLEERGHERLYPKVLRELTRELTKAKRQKDATVILAKESDGSPHQKSIVEALRTLGVTEYTTQIDPTIVGGFIAEGSTTRIDASYKKALLALHRSLIA